MCPWVGSHAPSCERQLWGLPSRMEYLSPQGVLLPRVYGATASPLWLELRGPAAWPDLVFWVCIRLGGREYLGVLDTQADISIVAKRHLPCGDLKNIMPTAAIRRVEVMWCTAVGTVRSMSLWGPEALSTDLCDGYRSPRLRSGYGLLRRTPPGFCPSRYKRPLSSMWTMATDGNLYLRSSQS